MTTTEPRAEQVLNVPSTARWPLATIHCFADGEGWHATLLIANDHAADAIRLA